MKSQLIMGCFLWAFMLCLAPTILASDTYYNAVNGVHCTKCAAGHKVVNDCTKNLGDPECAPCAEHHFMPDPNEFKGCNICLTQCPKFATEVQACTPLTDRVCECWDGYYAKSIDPVDPAKECVLHSGCQPGQGVQRMGTSSRDTVCEDCVAGVSFVNASDPDQPVCQTCGTCPNGTQLIHSCTLSSNTECSESNSTLTIPTTTSGPTTTLQDESEESDGLAPGGIIAIVVVVVGILVVGILILVKCIRGRKSGMPKRITAVFKAKSKKRSESTEGSVPERRPLIKVTDWDVDFIVSKVFTYLSKNLGESWKTFVEVLPGWPTDHRAGHVIYEGMQANSNSVDDAIFFSLKAWQRECPQLLTREILRNALGKCLSQTKSSDMIGVLDKIYLEDNPQNGDCTQNGHCTQNGDGDCTQNGDGDCTQNGHCTQNGDGDCTQNGDGDCTQNGTSIQNGASPV